MGMLFTSLIINLLLAVFCMKPSTSQSTETQFDEEVARKYLERFGYINSMDVSSRPASLMAQDGLKVAILQFQEFVHLKPTGQLDEDTVQMMKAPRCGFKDRLSAYAATSPWPKTHLTYSIFKYSRHLPRSTVDNEIRRAFDHWSNISPLVFAQSDEYADLKILFEQQNHDDGASFDGNGNILAHAFFPTDGRIHFDDDETWTVEEYWGINLFQVAVHEIGHALGLEHSNVRNSIMWPTYTGYTPNFTFDYDDVMGIQALYGTRSEGSDRVPGTNNMQLCDNGKLDAILDIARTVYVLRGSYAWILTSQIGTPAEGPTLISEMWPGLPGNIDAAFTATNYYAFFFKGNMYWKYYGGNLVSGYPQLISVGFKGVPNNIDAVLRWPSSNQLLFFKGDYYWIYYSNVEYLYRSFDPLHISMFEGIPANLDDAIYTYDAIYFFKNGEYYKYNKHTYVVDAANPPYPRDVKYYWFGCQSQ